jgi:hypothetical protein
VSSQRTFVSRILNKLLRRNKSIEVSWHPQFIRHISEVLKPSVYAEIGIYEGETFSLVDSPKKYAVDISESALNSIPNESRTSKILGTSKNLAFKLFEEDRKIDLIFIDANHDKMEVRQDFINLEPHFSDECVVLFHDTYPKNLEYADPKFCGDAYAAIPMLAAEYSNWAFVTIPIHPGLTIASRSPLFPFWLRK